MWWNISRWVLKCFIQMSKLRVYVSDSCVIICHGHIHEQNISSTPKPWLFLTSHFTVIITLLSCLHKIYTGAFTNYCRLIYRPVYRIVISTWGEHIQILVARGFLTGTCVTATDACSLLLHPSRCVLHVLVHHVLLTLIQLL